MGVESIKPRPNGLEHEATIAGRSYSVELVARVSGRDVGPVAVRDLLASYGIQAGSHYRWPLPPDAPTEEDFASFLQSVRVSHDGDNGKQYRVTLTYNTVDPVNDGPAQGGGVASWVMAPWMAPPSLDWDSEDYEFHPTHDREGTPILNTAGDPWDPSPSIMLPTPIAVITRVEQGFLPAWITTYKGTVNESAWMGFPAESVLCKDIKAKQQYDADHGWLYTVTYTFAFRPSVVASDDSSIVVAGWDLWIANIGRREKKTVPPLSGPSRVEIRDKDGQPISDPVPLKLDGTYDPEGDVIYRRFKIYKPVDFEFFNLPPTLFDYNPGP